MGGLDWDCKERSKPAPLRPKGAAPQPQNQVRRFWCLVSSPPTVKGRPPARPPLGQHFPESIAENPPTLVDEARKLVEIEEGWFGGKKEVGAQFAEGNVASF